MCTMLPRCCFLRCACCYVYVCSRPTSCRVRASRLQRYLVVLWLGHAVEHPLLSSSLHLECWYDMRTSACAATMPLARRHARVCARVCHAARSLCTPVHACARVQVELLQEVEHTAVPVLAQKQSTWCALALSGFQRGGGGPLPRHHRPAATAGARRDDERQTAAGCDGGQGLVSGVVWMCDGRGCGCLCGGGGTLAQTLAHPFTLNSCLCGLSLTLSHITLTISGTVYRYPMRLSLASEDRLEQADPSRPSSRRCLTRTSTTAGTRSSRTAAASCATASYGTCWTCAAR
jgi:hypothetical protein